MFTLKQAVEAGIEMGMTEFAIKHHAYEGSPIIQTADTVLDFIKGHENEIPVIIYYGSAYRTNGVYTSLIIVSLAIGLKMKNFL